MINCLLPGDPEGPVPLERWPWRRETLCYSSIAFAVVVRPDDSHAVIHKEEETRTKLYRYVKRIQLALLESGFVYPLVVVAIVASDNARTIVRRWVSDQDWHRGDFVLEIEPNYECAHNLVCDLLSREVGRLMGKRPTARTLADYIAALKDAPEPDSEQATETRRELTSLVLDVWRQYVDRPYNDDDASQARAKVDDWISRRIEDVRSSVQSAMEEVAE
jgi:cytochrome P450